MGHAASSCAPTIIFSNGVVKVLHLDGSLEIYTRGVKAAELMLEHPGQFVCDSSHLKVGHRVLGLVADEELERRQIYFVLPMEMLYSVLTNDEMSLLSNKASKALKNGNLSFSRILLGDFCMFPSTNNTRITSSSSGTKIMQIDQEGNDLRPELTKKYSRQRSWMPALETIVETPPRRL